jgi:hypothetical protein
MLTSTIHISRRCSVGLEIHCRQKEGKTVFRLWSTISDQYVTEDLTEEEVDRTIIQNEVSETIERCFRENPERINRAKKKGTSSMVDNAQGLNGPWEEERQE